MLIACRYAVDWQQSQNGKTFSGDASDKRSYDAYGKPVLAVADGIVVTARDGLQDNVPRHNGEFTPAVEMTPDTMFDNNIVLDLGGQQFADYCHLQPGSLRVKAKAGDHLRRGQAIAQIGVRSLFDYLEGGASLDEFLHQFPSVKREFAIAVLDAAYERVAADANLV